MTTLDSPYGLTKPADLVPEYGDSTFDNAEFKCSQNTGVFRWKNATGMKPYGWYRYGQNLVVTVIC